MKREYKRDSAPQGFFFGSVVAVLPFLILAVGNIFNQSWLDTMDQAIGQAAVNLRSDFLTPIFRMITIFGGTLFSIFLLVVVCSLFFFVLKKRDLAIWYGLTAAIGGGALNQIVKYAFQKPRPIFEHLVVQDGYTFPSGHAMGSIVVYGGLLFLLYRITKSQTLKTIFSIGIVVFILLIGLSRIYLGVHFASDIIGGYSLGGAALLASIGIYRILEINKSRTRF